MEPVNRGRRFCRSAAACVALALATALIVGAAACGGTTEPSPSPTATAATQATVPDLTTDHLVKTQAESEIEDAGLVPQVQPTFVADVPAGQVASQSPDAGQQVAKGSQVVMWISLGPKMAEVPRLVGEKGNTVGRLLRNIGLVGEKVNGASEKYPKGTCYKQLPGPKDQVPTGSTVVYYVSSGLPTVAVPNVVGKTLTAAETALARKKLTVAGTVEENSATVPKGDVMEQSVAAGTAVVAGTQLDLTVSKGPAEVVLTVPNVVDEYINTVLPELQVGGFANIYVDKIASDQPKGMIVHQLPRAGSRMNPNEQLVLQVSAGLLFR
jgi:eukaryotic-like serine/threonine-protein kinase